MHADMLSPARLQWLQHAEASVWVPRDAQSCLELQQDAMELVGWRTQPRRTHGTDGRLRDQRRSAAGRRFDRPCGDGSQKGCLGLGGVHSLLVCLFARQGAISIMRDEYVSADIFSKI